MKIVKILEQYFVEFPLPDDNRYTAHSQAAKLLKEKGCTVFREHKRWDPQFDGLVGELVGYVVVEE